MMPGKSRRPAHERYPGPELEPLGLGDLIVYVLMTLVVALFWGTAAFFLSFSVGPFIPIVMWALATGLCVMFIFGLRRPRSH